MAFATAERRCKGCGVMVLVAYPPDALIPTFFDLEEKTILTPGADGLWEARRGRVQHRCLDGEETPVDRGEWP